MSLFSKLKRISFSLEVHLNLGYYVLFKWLEQIVFEFLISLTFYPSEIFDQENTRLPYA